MTFVLSPAGRALTWSEWLNMGGCGLSQINIHMVSSWIGKPQSHWGDVTLGQIQEAWKPAGRELARFMVQYLDKTFFAMEEKDQSHNF